ncbi:kinetochore Sim4 complex subunit FTA2-domain-containing protein [Xylaria telfairii]|nr:kinetochore Sim4 complex subunit FTA2-domain-containing protein [Xylaria telfairii]
MTDLLPPINGPKLSPFYKEIRENNIEFKEYLGPDTTRWDSKRKPQSRVFRVLIDGDQYCLKVFGFIHPDKLRHSTPNGDDLLAGDLLRYQLHPFYAECRALGLLKEKNKNGELAVRCHGYASIPLAVEQQIRKQFGLDDWNRKPEDEGQPLWAIVKNYICSDSVCGGEELSVMRTKLQQLNDIGIYHMDIKEDNYRGGQLFDFSAAITRPNVWLRPTFRSWKLINEDLSYDLVAFDKMADDIKGKRIENQEIEE